jgi:hypothetical protein
MLLQRDNARPHKSLRTQEHITKMGWMVLPHPPYSPNLAPSDFHLFRSLKDALSGTQFEVANSVIEAVKKWLRRQDKKCNRQGVHALVPRWRKASSHPTDSSIHYLLFFHSYPLGPEMYNSSCQNICHL